MSQIQHRRGSIVRVKNVEPHDLVRGVKDGDLGEVLEPDVWDGKNPVRAPLVRFPEGDYWMALHKLEKTK